MRMSTVLLVASTVLALASATAVSHAESAKAEAGAAIYGDYCSSCHGEQLRNTSGGVTFDLRRLRPEDHERFNKSTLDGKAQMPPWRGVLNADQIDSIWAYIRSTVDKPR